MATTNSVTNYLIKRNVTSTLVNEGKVFGLLGNEEGITYPPLPGANINSANVLNADWNRSLPLDLTKGSTFYLSYTTNTRPNVNFTANIINVSSNANVIQNITLMIPQWANAYYPRTINIGNVNYGNVRFKGGSFAPTANALDILEITLVKIGDTWQAPIVEPSSYY